jgi:glycosyltransferase involved in cell wall biosynthesis
MKKVLIVTDTYAPEINGLATALFNLKIKLEEAGYKVVIIYPRMFPSIPVIFRTELRFAIFRHSKLKKIILREKPDYIHIASESSLGLAARSICLDLGLNFTSSYHTNFANYSKLIMRPLTNYVSKYLCWFHSKATRTMVATENLKNLLSDSGYKNVVVWQLGVDSEFFKKNLSAQIPANLTKPIFVYFGRVAIEKSPEDFLKCTLPGSKLVIGDGPLRNNLEKKYPKVKFVGYKTGQELVDLLSICDVYVFPSKTETFGLSVVEALACEVPVSAYNVAGPKDIISSGIDGYLGGNLNQGAIDCLKLDPKKCREKALKFTWQESMDEFIKHVELTS